MKDLLQLSQALVFSNLDLLGVGVTIAAIALLGFIVYISNTKSFTNISFVVFCAITMLWSFFNYISYQTADPEAVLVLWKVVIFFGLLHAFSFFNFLYVFPREKIKFPKWYTWFLFPYVIVISLWSLFGTLVFSHVVSNTAGIPQPVAEKGITLFVVTVFFLVVAGFYFLIKRIIKAKKEERRPYTLILIGAVLTFMLLFTFNLVLPALFKITSFISLGAVTIFPFAAFTSYAIFKHKTFKVANLGSTMLAFLLCVSAFVEIIFTKTTGELFLRSGVFLFVLLISIQFVKNIFMLERVTKRLEDANNQLKSLDGLKSEFISLASHQLRSPLTVIKGYASTLTDGIVGDLNDKQREIVSHIYASAQSLASMVEEFLNVTKIEQGGMKYSFEPVNITEIVTSLADEMKRTAEDKHLTFSITGVDAGVCMVQADAVKLRQVFLNLIDNSIKYTQEGFVTVSLAKNSIKHEVVISVTDSGVGISEETKKKLFTKFARGEEVSHHSGGSGLGLYLAQEVIKAHHGVIHVESKGVNQGSSFSVVLPCKE